MYLEGLNVGNETKVELVTFGIPREPWDFVRKAAQVGHPRFLPYNGSEQLDDSLWTNLNHHACALDDWRLAFFKKWVARAKELEKDERNLRLELGEHVRHVLQGKRLLNFKEILEDLQFPDKNLSSDIITGFRLSGWMRDSKVFMSLPRPPKLTLEALLKSSIGLQKAVLKRVREPEDVELHLAAWEETQAECERKWIWEDTSGDLHNKTIARRFGSRQNEKVRVIDNFKQSSLNHA